MNIRWPGLFSWAAVLKASMSSDTNPLTNPLLRREVFGIIGAKVERGVKAGHVPG